jgi:hypothetical protein
LAQLTFSVEGMVGATDAAKIVNALHEHGIKRAHFDSDRDLFRIEIDPRRFSFGTIRRFVSEVGRQRNLIYLAVIMSP